MMFETGPQKIQETKIHCSIATDVYTVAKTNIIGIMSAVPERTHSELSRGYIVFALYLDE